MRLFLLLSIFFEKICLSFKSSYFELQRRSLEIFLAAGNYYLGSLLIMPRTLRGLDGKTLERDKP
jgi:hypothetical protein